MDILNKIKTRFLTALAVAAVFVATSCAESLFDYETDCDVSHRIKFVYDMNLKWADAFPSEVKSVDLFVFDKNGLFVKQYDAAGEEIAQPGYSMLLDLPADSYKFVAWCGLRNEGADEESFTVPQPVPGVTTIDQLTCTLNTKSSSEHAMYSDTELHFLYHGYLEATLVDNHDGQTYEHVIRLTKDTNHIRIILQELSSDEDMNPDHYGIRILSANSKMAYNNDVQAVGQVTYLPWSKDATEVGIGRVETDGEVKYIKGVVADLSLARLMVDEAEAKAGKDKALMLVITDETTLGPVKDEIATIPLIDWALMSKDYYEAAYKHRMTNQEMLDREDEYIMTFFLVQGKWIESYIDILQWRIVKHNYDIGS